MLDTLLLRSINAAAGDTLLQLVCCPAQTTRDLMQDLWRRNIDTENRRLMFGSQRLEDVHSLSSSGVLDGSVLVLAPADAGERFSISVRVCPYSP